ncbi:MAG: biotin--[acetyl-CoA-carboxylase] ligase [Rikenellaceae bacterium]
MIHRFDSLGSTNDQAQEAQYTHGDIIVAERQSAGRGQRGNKWLSGEGLNLTLSAVVCPSALEARNQFLVSQATALAICDMLRLYGLDARIKWTNDIYIGDRKIVGILIENKVSGALLVRSIVGIGLNVNQREFDPSLPNPTSMALEAKAIFDRDEVLDRLAEALASRFKQIESGEGEVVRGEYHSLMYRCGEAHQFKLPSGELRMGTIEGVASSGELKIAWSDGARASYMFGAIDFVIEGRKR